MPDVLLRPMRPGDVATAERLSADAFYDLDLRLRRPGMPDPVHRPATRAEGWIRRTERLLDTDPGGCWVAEDASGMLGFATSIVRETLWCLATYVVRPDRQGGGIGKPLLEAALQHSQGCLRGMLAASADPKALRRYRLAGFDLHPQMQLEGKLDRSVIPPLEKVREGTAADEELMNSVDRRTRGAGHGPDHEAMRARWPLLVSDSSTGSGYVYVDLDGGVLEPQLLAASNRRTATRLLWAALALGGERVRIPHITGANQWLLDVGMALRLELSSVGYLGVRGMAPPAPYLHNGSLL